MLRIDKKTGCRNGGGEVITLAVLNDSTVALDGSTAPILTLSQQNHTRIRETMIFEQLPYNEAEEGYEKNPGTEDIALRRHWNTVFSSQ